MKYNYNKYLSLNYGTEINTSISDGNFLKNDIFYKIITEGLIYQKYGDFYIENYSEKYGNYLMKEINNLSLKEILSLIDCFYVYNPDFFIKKSNIKLLIKYYYKTKENKKISIKEINTINNKIYQGNLYYINNLLRELKISENIEEYIESRYNNTFLENVKFLEQDILSWKKIKFSGENIDSILKNKLDFIIRILIELFSQLLYNKKGYLINNISHGDFIKKDNETINQNISILDLYYYFFKEKLKIKYNSNTTTAGFGIRNNLGEEYYKITLGPNATLKSVIHELVHLFQRTFLKYSGLNMKDGNLGIILKEGGANFIMYYVILYLSEIGLLEKIEEIFHQNNFITNSKINDILTILSNNLLENNSIQREEYIFDVKYIYNKYKKGRKFYSPYISIYHYFFKEKNFKTAFNLFIKEHSLKVIGKTYNKWLFRLSKNMITYDTKKDTFLKGLDYNIINFKDILYQIGVEYKYLELESIMKEVQKDNNSYNEISLFRLFL